MAESSAKQVRETIDHIIRESDKAIRAAQAVELLLQKRVNDLLLKVQRSGSIESAERRKIERLGQDLQTVRMTIALLALETMQRVDASSETMVVKAEIAAVTRSIDAQVRRLKNVDASQAVVRKLADHVAKVQDELKKLAS